MKEDCYIPDNESKILKILFAALLFLTLASISSKFIAGYNSAVADEQRHLSRIAENGQDFYATDCYRFYNHTALFALFSVFILLFSLSTKRFTKTNYFSVISFFLLSLTLLQATYLHLRFAEIVGIEWNSLLVLPNVLDAFLYFCFASVLILQTKIIYRFVKENFRVKIS